MAIMGSPWSATDRRRAIRAPVNPLDKATVVSIFPRLVDETKVTIQPGRFIIQPGTYNEPSVLVVGPSSWWRDLDLEQPLLEIPVSSIQIADSIVKDYCNGLLSCDMSTRMPGLFYLQGAKTVEMIKKEHKADLDAAKRRQDEWYKELINQADVDWARTNGNPLAVSDLSRLGCQELQYKEKPWMANIAAMQMINCKACGNLVRPGYPICSNCKTIVDQELYNKMNLKQAV